MIIYYDNRFAAIKFGVEKLKDALKRQGEFYIEKELQSFNGMIKNRAIVALIESSSIRFPSVQLEDGGFELAISQKTIYIIGKDYSGVMYGLLDIAETIQYFGLDSIKDKWENPFMKMRGVKFNLPFEPYDKGDPFEKNFKTCLDSNFWKEYIDFLALNRYNCLSLWSEHPFHMMFRLDKYPQTCPYTDTELERYKELYKYIFRYAKDRGIDVYLITWNIRLTPFVAEGLGLPPELGNMEDRYNVIYDECNGISNNTSEFDAIRQYSEIIKDYFRECIKMLIMTYRDLTGIGTTCSEEMVGDTEERHQWVVETYLKAVSEARRDIVFIHRTNCTNGRITKEVFMDNYPYERKYISWKYSNAHMYSHPLPQFEKLWGTWDNMNFDDIKVIYTVRNDDFHTLRWGDPHFIKAYIKGMNKPYVYGFYWGADGYLWGDDFQHVPRGHKTWKYDFERHWYEFELLGRLGYNPDLSESIWIEKCKNHYGKLWGEHFYHALMASSKIIPAVNRLFWINYDFEWHPESLLSVFGFKTILDFMNGEPMPGVRTIGIKEYVESDLAKKVVDGETPKDIISIINGSVQTINNIVKKLKQAIPKDYMGGEIHCMLLDLEAWLKLGEYYENKFTAALNMVYYDKTGNKDYKQYAVVCLKKGLRSWKELSYIWATHNMPYKMTRSKQIFGWSYYIEDVERDIDLAREYLCTWNNTHE